MLCLVVLNYILVGCLCSLHIDEFEVSPRERESFGTRTSVCALYTWPRLTYDYAYTHSIFLNL